eukprot:CCRYP_015898-RA/>CCRYP_015898-RA protein AED:0.25 eAED:0.21 QI:0/-1/0/1/-1/1/1/0/129
MTNNKENNNISVWWTATLHNRTFETHTLTPEELDEINLPNHNDGKDDVVVIPVYELDYDPLSEHGFAKRSVEQVAFVSDTMLLNLSTEEVMIYRREGEPSPPSSLVREEDKEEEEEEEVRHLTAAGIPN